MNRILLVLATWIAFVSFADLVRGDSDTYDPIILAAVTVESARSYCADIEINPDSFKHFLSTAGLGHAEVYHVRRSHRLRGLIEDLKGRLRTDLDAECKRIWTTYGPESTSISLLQSRPTMQSWRRPSVNVRVDRLKHALAEWLAVPSMARAEMPRSAIYTRFGRGVGLYDVRLSQ